MGKAIANNGMHDCILLLTAWFEPVSTLKPVEWSDRFCYYFRKMGNINPKRIQLLAEVKIKWIKKSTF